MEGTLQQIPVVKIRDHVGTPPSSKLRQSISRLGVVQPVILAKSSDPAGSELYLIVDGNRRIASARRAKIHSVPALVLTDVDADQVARLTLLLNGFRCANYLTDFWAIKRLQRSNYSGDEIQQVSGLTENERGKRELLSVLNRELFVGLRNGKIYQTHAAAIAKLPPSEQSQLATLFRRNGRLQKQDFQDIASTHGQDTTLQSTEHPPIVPTLDAQPKVCPQPVRWHDQPTPAQPIDTSSPIAVAASTIDNSKQASELTDISPPTVKSDWAVQIDEQMDTLHQFRTHLMQAATAAELLGMDRYDFLAQASKMWDAKGKPVQHRLVPDQPTEVIPSLRVSASKAEA